MVVFANVVGLMAVALFVLSYQFKNRRGIILCNASSRVLYVAQYFLLGAFEGALLDITAFFVSLVCMWRENKLFKKFFPLIVVLVNLVIIGVGLLSYKNVFSLLPILGVIFETQALWLKNEIKILWLSLLGAPFWLVYNLLNGAYGSAVGNVITLVSITIALVRNYSAKHKKTA